MGQYIIKPDIDLDFYIEWSTVVDNWTFMGTWYEMLDEGISKDRLTRAKETGSSSYDGNGDWYDEEITVHNLPEKFYEDLHNDSMDGYFTVTRSNLIDFVFITSENTPYDKEELLKVLNYHPWE